MLTKEQKKEINIIYSIIYSYLTQQHNLEDTEIKSSILSCKMDSFNELVNNAFYYHKTKTEVN